jgi:GT2 family glycosyltransferase
VEEPLVSFIVGNYDGEKVIGECLEAILAQAAAPLEVIVVDDASQDASVESVRHYPRVKLLVNKGNKGLAVCRNRGLAESRGRYVAFIDNDAVLDPGWLEAMLAAVEEWPDARLFASHLVFYHDPSRVNSTGGFANLAAYAWDRSIYREDEEVQVSPQVFFPCGAAMFMPRALLTEVGGFDAAYRYSYDDMELGWRTLMRGYRVVYVEEAVARHHFSYTVGRYNPRKLYLYERNRIRALLKNMEASMLRSVAADVAALYLHRLRVELTKPENDWWTRARYTLRMLEALLWNAAHAPSTLRERKKTLSLRKVTDQELVNAGLLYGTVDTPPVTADSPLLDYVPFHPGRAEVGKRDLHMVRRDAEYLGEGWHNQEQTPKGVGFRWTEREAVVVMSGSGHPRRLVIETLLANPREDTLVDVSVNGREAGRLTVANEPARHELQLAPEALNGHLEVRLRVRNPFNPAELTGGEDRRLLGVAVTRITVR